MDSYDATSLSSLMRDTRGSGSRNSSSKSHCCRGADVALTVVTTGKVGRAELFECEEPGKGNVVEEGGEDAFVAQRDVEVGTASSHTIPANLSVDACRCRLFCVALFGCGNFCFAQADAG